MADTRDDDVSETGDDENAIIKLTNRIAKKHLRAIASKDVEEMGFDDARVVTAYKQAAIRSKGEVRQAVAGMDMEGLNLEEVERLALQIHDKTAFSPGGDDDE